eukprot:1902801-Prorocentrum_lima.AAC.1
MGFWCGAPGLRGQPHVPLLAQGRARAGPVAPLHGGWCCRCLCGVRCGRCHAVPGAGAGAERPPFSVVGRQDLGL